MLINNSYCDKLSVIFVQFERTQATQAPVAFKTWWEQAYLLGDICLLLRELKYIHNKLSAKNQ